MHSVVRRAAWRAVRAGRRAAGGGSARGQGGQGGHGGDGAQRGEGDSPLRRLVRDAAQFGEAERGAGELQWATQPYATRPGSEGEGAGAGGRVDPRDACVWLFPGQGAQHAGMGRRLADVPAARDVYDLAAEVLGWDVYALCRSGTEAALRSRAQSCVLVTALAGAAALGDERPGLVARAAAAAGYSLGELAALTWAGALPLEDALRVVAVREAATRAVSARRPAGMLCVWLAPDARLHDVLAGARDATRCDALPDPVCQVATYLYPNCKVLAGDEQCMVWVERCGRALGVRRSARVSVCGAFHTALMEEAAARLGDALAAARVSPPRLRVVSALDARTYTDAADVRRRVVRTLVRPARWEQTLHALFARARDEPQPQCVLLPPHAHSRTQLRMVNARAWDAHVVVKHTLD